MILSVQFNNNFYEIDFTNPIDISIALVFNKMQPNAFGVKIATARTYQTENLIGDTRRGGSCNFEEYKFIPHCNGTHTECVGHLTEQRISIHESLKDVFIPASVVTVQPEIASETVETYSVSINPEDKLITKKLLENVLENTDENFLQGLIVRTLPNDKSKKTRIYGELNSPYFSLEAMRFIREKNVTHLLVDLPSIDRMNDEGKLANHRIFWNVEKGSCQLWEGSLVNNTITELIYVPKQVKDGNYILNLQSAPFVSDASPSRPVLFELLKSKST